MTVEQRSSDRIIHDENSKDIKALIMETPDPKDKAVLMILLKISDDLFRNTQLTLTLSDKFETHVNNFVKHAEDEMKIVNQGRGFLRGIISALVIIQMLVGFIFVSHMADFARLQEQVKELEEEGVRHKEHHRMEELMKKHRGALDEKSPTP